MPFDDSLHGIRSESCSDNFGPFAFGVEEYGPCSIADLLYFALGHCVLMVSTNPTMGEGLACLDTVAAEVVVVEPEVVRVVGFDGDTVGQCYAFISLFGFECGDASGTSDEVVE